MRTPTIFIPHGSGDDINSSFGLRGLFAGINREASPIYTGITVTRSGSGTRIRDFGGITVEQEISYSASHTFDRYFLPDQSLVISDQNQYSDGLVESFTFPEDFVSPVGETSFLHSFFGRNRGGPTSATAFANPKKHFLGLAGFFGIEDVNFGTQTDTDDYGSSVIDIIEGLQISCPFFTYNDPSSIPLPKEYDQWNCRIGVNFGAIGFTGPANDSTSFGIDVTGYSATKWRNIKGTYTLSVNDSDIVNLWDSNSLVHTNTWTIF